MATISVKDHGAVGDGSTDDRSAIATAISNLSNGDTLTFPDGGTYVHSPAPSGLSPFAFDNMSNITIKFIGGSVLKRKDQDYTGVGDDYALYFTDCDNFTLLNVSMDGNRHAIEASTSGGYATIDEQTHCLQLGEGCSNFLIENFKGTRSLGDSIRLLGANDNHATGVTINHPRIDDFLRSGIGMQRAIDDVTITIPVIVAPDDGDQCIDSEPTGTPGANDGPSDIRILGGILDGRATNNVQTLTVGTASGVALARRWYIDGTHIYGDMRGLNLDTFEMVGVRVTGNPDSTGNAMQISRQLTGAKFIDCIFDKRDVSTYAVKLDDNNGTRPTDAEFSHCLFRGKNGLLLEQVTGISAHDCEIIGDDVSGSVGIKVETQGDDDSENMLIERNDIANVATGALFDARNGDITRTWVQGTHVNVSTDKTDTTGGGYTITDL